MRIVEVKTLEECLDGVAIKDYYLDKPMTLQSIHKVAEGYKLDYFKFARAFYRIHAPGLYVLKGVEGNTSIQALFPSFRPEQETELKGRLEHGDE